jgi:hypothetical protein
LPSTRKGPLLQEGLSLYEAWKPRLISVTCPASCLRHQAVGNPENYFFLVGFLVAFFFAGIVVFSLDLDLTVLVLPGFLLAGIWFLLWGRCYWMSTKVNFIALMSVIIETRYVQCKSFD